MEAAFNQLRAEGILQPPQPPPVPARDAKYKAAAEALWRQHPAFRDPNYYAEGISQGMAALRRLGMPAPIEPIEGDFDNSGRRGGTFLLANGTREVGLHELRQYLASGGVLPDYAA